MTNNTKAGKAYAFFYCDAPKQKIEDAFPELREAARTPSKLELSLTEGVHKFLGEKVLAVNPIDTQLGIIAREAKESGMRYVMEATCEGESNKKTADEVADILGAAYQSHLYHPENKQPFRGAVVYREGNEYVFRE